MIEPIDADSTTSVPRTPAYTNFDLNTDRLTHFIAFIGRGVPGISKEADFSKINSILSTISNQKQESNIEERVAEVKQGIAEVNQEILAYAGKLDAYNSGLNVGLEWISVLMVTIVESYLIDVLVYAASADPTLMQKSQMPATYSEVINASSLENLLQDLRYRWARKFINEGGPKYWIHTLTKMGARGYSLELTREMETLWGIRHLIVHSTGISTPDFVQRHSDFGVAVGERVQVKLNHLSDWGECIYHFVDVTDAYFAQRCNLNSFETES